jgi:nucleoside-diphosphate-sugar epimerase
MTEPVRRMAVVTGGAGAIGASIAAALSAAGPGPYGSDGPLLSLRRHPWTIVVVCAAGGERIEVPGRARGADGVQGKARLARLAQAGGGPVGLPEANQVLGCAGDPASAVPVT